jgi:RecA/RadA recombinase
MAGTYLKHYADEDATLVFYDSEFGSPASYFEAYGVDTDRVLHKPIKNIEELKFDVSNTLDEIKRGDRVIVLIDSLGNLASKKEVEDALDEKSVADMSRAKAFKSLFRIMTPHLNMKDIPLIGINHTYKEIGLFPKDIVSGGTGAYYSADNIFIIGRQQEKDGTEVIGYNFVVNVEKSRFVKEKSKIPIEVTFEGGISTWSGLLDVAIEGGFVVKPSNGWYSHKDDDKKYRLKDTYTKEFWLPILADKNFRQFIDDTYRIAGSEMLRKEVTAEEIDEEFENASEV